MQERFVRVQCQLSRLLTQALGCAVILAGFGSSMVFALDNLDKADKLKAAYLLNFTKYMEWPVQNDRTALNERSVIVDIQLCVASSTEFRDFLTTLVKGRKVGKLARKVQVLPLENSDVCDLTFVQFLPQYDIQAKDLGVLIIDSADIVLGKNVAITFFTQKRKLRFEIDLKVTKTTGVSVSSELLKLARSK